MQKKQFKNELTSLKPEPKELSAGRSPTTGRAIDCIQKQQYRLIHNQKFQTKRLTQIPTAFIHLFSHSPLDYSTTTFVFHVFFGIRVLCFVSCWFLNVPLSSDAESIVNAQVNENTYIIRPNFKQKFRPAAARDIIRRVLGERLNGLSYHSENTSQWTREIADEIKARLKAELGLPRYKYVVQVVIAEQRGEGVRMACRCFWDSDSDHYAQAEYLSDTLTCVAGVWGVYHY